MVDATGIFPVASIPFGFCGAPAGIRTPDTLLKRQVLCLLSYWGMFGDLSTKSKRSEAVLILKGKTRLSVYGIARVRLQDLTALF